MTINRSYLGSFDMKRLAFISTAIYSSLWGLTAVSQNPANQRPPNPYEGLNIKAHVANAEQATSIDDLTSAVMDYPHGVPIPPALKEMLGDRFSQAELSYRRGQGPGIREGDLLVFMNHMCTKLGLPSYALVTPNQLRFLRMTLILHSPDLMGMGASRPNMRIGDSIPDTLSPLQALHLFQTMLDQKISNSEYQDPSIDLSARTRQYQIQEEKINQSGGKMIPQVTLTQNPKNTEMRHAIAAGTQSLSMQDAYFLVDQALRTWNIR